MIIKMGIAFVVQLVIVMIYSARIMPELLQSAGSYEELTQKAIEKSSVILQYATEISAFSALLTIPVLTWMFRRDRKKEAASGVLSAVKAPIWKYTLIAGFGITLAVALNNILLLSNLAEYSESYQEASAVLYTPSLPIQILCLGIIIPIMEELIFRGLIFKRIREDMPMLPAILYSGIFFGIYHGNMVQMIYGTVAGVMLAYVYEKFGSFKAPVFMHMIMNCTACIVTAADGFTWMFSQPLRMGIITVVCALVAAVMFVLIRELGTGAK